MIEKDNFADRNRQYVFRASIKLKNGKTIYARSYGKRAFRIPVEE